MYESLVKSEIMVDQHCSNATKKAHFADGHIWGFKYGSVHSKIFFMCHITRTSEGFVDCRVIKCVTAEWLAIKWYILYSFVITNLFEQTTSENLLEDDRSSAEKSIIKTDERKDYNLKVLKYVQCIFAHLAGSKLQFYVPQGFWKHFRSVFAHRSETGKFVGTWNIGGSMDT